MQDTLIEINYEIAEFQANNQHRPLEQIKAEVRYLRKKLDGHIDPSKEKKGGIEI